MKKMLEEYGAIVVFVLMLFIILMAATPIGGRVISGVDNLLISLKENDMETGKVRYWVQNIGGDVNRLDHENYSVYKTKSLTGTGEVTPEVIELSGCTALSVPKTVTLTSKGYTVVDYYYKRIADTAYQVKHWQQKVGGDASIKDELNYTLKDTETLAGERNTDVTPDVKSYMGFTAPEAQTVAVMSDGSTVVNYYYTRNSYTLTLNKGNGISEVNGAGTYQYGESVTFNAIVLPGYEWDGWTGIYQLADQEHTFTMPAGNVTYTAKTTVRTYAISYELNGGTVTGNPESYTPATETFSLENPTRAGYTFLGWTGSNGTTAQIDVSIAKGSFEDKHFTANWKANTDTAYIVNHYQQNIADDDYTLTETENLKGITDTNVIPGVKNYVGFTAPETQTATIKGDGSLVVNYYYTRNSYSVILNKAAGISEVSGAGVYKYGASVTINAVLSDGYEWIGWTGTHDVTDQQYVFTMPAENVTYTANAKTAYAAVYGGTNLVFGKAAVAPTTYNGLELTESWTGIESLQATSNSAIPWKSYVEAITEVVVVDEIQPVSTAYWFYNFKNCSSIDLAKLDTAEVTTMAYMFFQAEYNTSVFKLIGLDDWDVSSVTNMDAMFQEAGYNASTFNLELNGWNTSKVTSMKYMFFRAGYNSSTLFKLVGLDNWDVSAVKSMAGMFRTAGFKAKTFNLDLSRWNVSAVENMFEMFAYTGSYSTSFNLNLSNWNTSNVTTTADMFNGAGQYSTSFNVNLSKWDVSAVRNMSNMFIGAGQSSSNWSIEGLSNWDVSSVTNMYCMFYLAGRNATTFSLDLSQWDVSSVTEMYSMFRCAGQLSTSWSIGDISGWDTSKVTGMRYMFAYAGTNAPYSLDLSGWNVGKISSSNNREHFNVGVEYQVKAPAWPI